MNKVNTDYRLKCKTQKLKILDENSKTSDISRSTIFSKMSSQVGETKGKINKWDHIKLKSLHSKGNQPNEKTTH